MWSYYLVASMLCCCCRGFPEWECQDVDCGTTSVVDGCISSCSPIPRRAHFCAAPCLAYFHFADFNLFVRRVCCLMHRASVPILYRCWQDRRWQCDINMLLDRWATGVARGTRITCMGINICLIYAERLYCAQLVITPAATHKFCKKRFESHIEWKAACTAQREIRFLSDRGEATEDEARCLVHQSSYREAAADEAHCLVHQR